MLERIHDLIEKKEDFAFETTLATLSNLGIIRKAQKLGYFISLVFFWLESGNLAIQRVKKRGSEEGHHIPEVVIRRRYKRGIINLFKQDSAWRRRAIEAVLFQPTPNFLKIVNFPFTLNHPPVCRHRQAVSKVMLCIRHSFLVSQFFVVQLNIKFYTCSQNFKYLHYCRKPGICGAVFNF